jgi:hypothetical protein
MKIPHQIKLTIFTGVFVLILNILPSSVKAQSGPPGDPDAPIDGGVSLLVAAGIGYGIKKHRKDRKDKTTEIK